jgi:fatty acid desaturase
MFASVAGFGVMFSGAAFPAFVVVVLLSQIAIMAFIYLLSFLFKTEDSVGRILPIIVNFCALIPGAICFVLFDLIIFRNHCDGHEFNQ